MPTRELANRQRAIVSTLRDDHNDGARFYNSRKERFSSFFDGRKSMEPSSFAARYASEIEKLVTEYRHHIRGASERRGSPGTPR